VKEFTEENFIKLSPDRQIKVSLDLVYKIEEFWLDDSKQESYLQKLKTHLLWLSKNPNHLSIKPMALFRSLETEPSLRKILNVAMAFERSLALSLKDESILVKSSDSAEAKASTQPIFIVLDNLRSAHNVGSIFRSAEGLGVEHIFLVGYTATPKDKSVKKTAMGSDEFVSWSHTEKIDDVIKELKEKNIKLAALETAETALDLDKSKTSPGLALFLGNERFGLDSKVLKDMDYILEIKMRGRKNSLNVSNACAIAVYEILRSWSL